MSEKHSLETFMSDIDKIVSGDAISASDCEHRDEEYKDLLSLARLLVQADYTPEGGDRMQELIAKIQDNDELEDDELDMVAGGVKLDDILDEGKKRDKEK